MKERLYELDFLKGIAVILMVLFHLVVDLRDIYNCNITYEYGFWYFIGKLSAIMFITISGILTSFTNSRIKSGIKLFLLGILLTLITALFSPDLYIKFGILHFLGISMIISSIIKIRNKPILLITAISIVATGNIIDRFFLDVPFLFPIGIKNAEFTSLDYFPLLPWYGVFLSGILLGRLVYKDKKSLISIHLKDNFVCYVGKNSLAIYFIHQPILLTLTYIFLHYHL